MAAFKPSPQIFEQIFGVAKVQVYPCSIKQEFEQPSPFDKLPSSQASVEFLTPFPQTLVHIEGELEQEYPGLIIDVFEQPSELLVLLSSHYSVPTMYPSMYLGMQVSGEVEFPPEQVHVERIDIQFEAHPSPSD